MASRRNHAGAGSASTLTWSEIANATHTRYSPWPMAAPPSRRRRPRRKASQPTVNTTGSAMLATQLRATRALGEKNPLPRAAQTDPRSTPIAMTAVNVQGMHPPPGWDSERQRHGHRVVPGHQRRRDARVLRGLDRPRRRDRPAGGRRRSPGGPDGVRSPGTPRKHVIKDAREAEVSTRARLRARVILAAAKRLRAHPADP